MKSTEKQVKKYKMEFQIEKLHTMKRVELQRLCKKFRIKANMKTTELINRLTEYGCKGAAGKDCTQATGKDDQLKTKKPGSCGSEIINEAAMANKEETLAPPQSEDTKTVEREEDVDCRSGLVDDKKEKPLKAASKIPRLTGLNPNNNATPTNIKNKTPKCNRAKDWSKIHQKQFEKMDSLDVYLEKKRKRAEELGTSNQVKKVKLHVSIQEDVPITKKTGKTISTTPKPQEKSVVKKVELRRETLTCNSSKKTAKENSTITPGKQHRRVTLAATKLTTESAQKPTTPFRFSSSQNTLFSPTPRITFDLKASLAKPLLYKPYTGKLQSAIFTKNDPKVVSVKKIKTHERDVKEVKVTSRKERCEQQMKKQSKRRADKVSKCRGIV